MQYRNDLEIRIFGLRRSGNHAVINWIGAQAPSMPHYFDKAPGDGADPFGKKASSTAQDSEISNIWYPHKHYKEDSPEKRIYIKTHKKILMYSYEEVDIKQLEIREIPHNREKVVGKSKRQIDILILRDFVNWAASKIFIPSHRVSYKHKHSWQDLTEDRFDRNRNAYPFFNYYDGWQKDAAYIRGLNYISMEKRMVNLWLNFAKEYCRETMLFEDPILISFNRWAVDKEYREKIINRIGFEFTDRGRKVVSKTGGGSTFQPEEKDALNLDLFNRWKLFKDNRIFKDFVRYHEEHLNYSNIIFGENKEITEWLSS